MGYPTAINVNPQSALWQSCIFLTSAPAPLTWVRLHTAGIELFVSGGGNTQYVPLDTRVVLLQVDAHLHEIRVGSLSDVSAGQSGDSGGICILYIGQQSTDSQTTVSMVLSNVR